MRGLLHALFLISATLLATPAGAAVYKCTINGETRYQDEPCPGDRDAKPHMEFKPDPTIEPEAQDEGETQTASPAAESDSETASTEPDRQASKPDRSRERRDRALPSLPAAPVEEGPMDRVAQLGADIEAAEVELRGVVDERRAVMADLDVRLAANRDDARLQAERKQRESEFRERRAEVSDRLRRLRAELASECPNGTFLNGTRQACR